MKQRNILCPIAVTKFHTWLIHRNLITVFKKEYPILHNLMSNWRSFKKQLWEAGPFTSMMVPPCIHPKHQVDDMIDLSPCLYRKDPRKPRSKFPSAYSVMDDHYFTLDNCWDNGVPCEGSWRRIQESLKELSKVNQVLGVHHFCQIMSCPPVRMRMLLQLDHAQMWLKEIINKMWTQTLWLKGTFLSLMLR